MKLNARRDAPYGKRAFHARRASPVAPRWSTLSSPECVPECVMTAKTHAVNEAGATDFISFSLHRLSPARAEDTSLLFLCCLENSWMLTVRPLRSSSIVFSFLLLIFLACSPIPFQQARIIMKLLWIILSTLCSDITLGQLSNDHIEACSDLEFSPDDGHLQCLGDEDNSVEVPFFNTTHAKIDNVTRETDLRAWLDEFDNTTKGCEESFDDFSGSDERVLPARHGDTAFEPCPDDSSLCCYYPQQYDGMIREAFRLVEVGEYWYRIHFKANPRDDMERYDHMSMIFRVCKDDDNCAEGETPPAWNPPGNTTASRRPGATSTGSSPPHLQKTETSSVFRTTTSEVPTAIRTQDSSLLSSAALTATLRNERAV